MRFETRKDLWLSLVIWFCVASLLFAGLSPFIVDEPISKFEAIILLVVTYTLAIFVAWLWVGTWYELQETELIIKFGPFKKRLIYSNIREALPTQSIISSAATSVHRIEIKYNRYDTIHISPMNQKTFLLELQQYCPEASIEMPSKD